MCLCYIHNYIHIQSHAKIPLRKKIIITGKCFWRCPVIHPPTPTVGSVIIFQTPPPVCSTNMSIFLKIVIDLANPFPEFPSELKQNEILYFCCCCCCCYRLSLLLLLPSACRCFSCCLLPVAASPAAFCLSLLLSAAATAAVVVAVPI